MRYRITVDVGGTFTDVVLADTAGRVSVGKAPTTPSAFGGISAALEVVGAERGLGVEELLADTHLFVYSTTRATNAILEGKTARTALLTTAGFPDILLLREGGKRDTFDLAAPYPPPYVPRQLTFEVPERIDAEGDVLTPLDEDAVRQTVDRLPRIGVEAVAVCLLWSIANPVHELRVGEILAERAPELAVTLSHRASPIRREFRRASTTAIDASLKPLMSAHLEQVGGDLEAAGFRGELLAATSFGGVMHIDDLAARPAYSAKSGPALAPVAARTYGAAELDATDMIVCDMGGTSFDVSLVRDGEVSFTRSTWLGGEYVGHFLATSSVDVRSIGAGGGSLASIDAGGLLRVGPESAGADPGPACYGRGGDGATVTDAALVLGYLDPTRFLGGRMTLDLDAARAVVGELAVRIGLDVEQAASAILAVANEHMVGAIAEMTINEGVDPRDSLLVAGGGAAGAVIGKIAAEIGCSRVLVPRTAGALSAMGGQFTDVVADFGVTHPTDTPDFDFDGVAAVLADLDAQGEAFAARLRERGIETIHGRYLVEARYAYQVWDLELPLPTESIRGEEDLIELRAAFDRLHERVFAVSEPGQDLELLTWRKRVVGEIGSQEELVLGDGHAAAATDCGGARTSRAFFAGSGWVDTPVHDGAALGPGAVLEGPAIVTEPSSTIVVYPGSTATVTAHDNYLIEVTR